MFAKPGPSVIPGSKDTISNEEWRSALRLSTMWNFTDIRQAAITALDHSMEDPLERIVIAREFHVRKWLVDAYEQLVLGDLKILEPSRCMEALGSQALARLLYARAEHGTFPQDTVRLAEHLNSGRSGLTYPCQRCGHMRQFGNPDDHPNWCSDSVVVHGGQPQAGIPTGGSSSQLTNIIEKLFAEEFQQMD
ncbi:hypothetical protein BJ165DRAFT_1489376 [Panaeolus papilionaceus]|nr:hypothetical protein BJ165DRAFT_1489376 [Panaeolus papilionaceus]